MRLMISVRLATLGALLALPLAAQAQPRPGAFTTITLTDTTSSALKVGCAVGATPCTGGIIAGPIDVSQITSAGPIGIASNVPGDTSLKLYNNSGTLTWNGAPLAVGASLSGTIGKIAKFTASNAVGDSIMTESGTTITVANTLAATTVTATTLTGTLSTVSQPNVTTMGGLTTAGALASVGTIASGTWQGTIIDLARGGAGVSLSGTGGASQFLRQNTLGGTITVVRPAVADLSDGSNVALLNAANTFSNSGSQTIAGSLAFSTSTAGVAGPAQFKSGNTFVWTGGTSGFLWSTQNNATNLMTLSNTGQLVLTQFTSAGHQITGGGVGDHNVIIRNTTAGTGNSASLYLGNDASASLLTISVLSSTYTSAGRFQANGVDFENAQAGGISIGATNAAGVIRFYGNGATQRMQVASGVSIGNSSDGGAGTLSVNSLTSGRCTFAGSNGLLTDDADCTFATDTLTATKIVAPTSITVGGGATVTRLDFGTFTPTVTSVANLDATPSGLEGQWSRVGAMVTMSGSLGNINPTAATNTQCRITLPVASNLTSSGDLNGSGAILDAAGNIMAVTLQGDATNDAALFEWVAIATGGGAGVGITYTFTYEVK